MKRFVFFLCSVMSAAALQAAPGDNVVASEVDGLRLRSQPTTSGAVLASLARGEEVLALGKTDSSDTIDNLTAPWYRVLLSTGQIGWAFGGYVDARWVWPDLFFLGAEQDAATSLRSYSSGFDNGNLVLVQVIRSDRSDPNVWPSMEVMFVKTQQGAPQVVFAQETGSAYDETAHAALDRIETVDVIGDSRKEVCATVSTRSEDGGRTEWLVYGALAGNDLYTMFGSITLSEFAVGDLEVTSAVRDGPQFVREAGRRLIRVVRVTSAPPTYMRPADESHPEGQPLAGTREETYELQGSTLVLAETKDIAPGNP